MTARVTSGRNAAPGLAIVLALAFGLGLTFATGEERATSPWPVVTPESQGFDSGLLAELLGHVRTKGLPLHNLLLIRRGRLILDASLYPYSPEGLHDSGGFMQAVDIDASGSFHASSPRPLFRAPSAFGAAAGQYAHGWDVTPDGRQFLTTFPIPDTPAQAISVILNWQSMLVK